MTEPRSLFDVVTAAVWFALAAIGIYRRVRRWFRLQRIVLPEPLVPADADYLASVKRSTLLRLGVKVVLLIGAFGALFDVVVLWPLWRLGIIAILALMLAETVSVDGIRDRLGRVPAESG